MFATQKLFRINVPGALGLILLLTSAPSPVWGDMFSAATYKVEFMGNWSADTHPTNFPAGAHFSPLIGGVHNASVSFWKTGERASAGIEAMAEIGATTPLREEISMEVGMGNVGSIIQPSLSDLTGTGGTLSGSFTIVVSTDFPLVTLLTMIAPSPDWFVGVSGLNLMDGQGNWHQSHMVDLFPYDAGTEDGETFSLNNAATMPQGTITRLRGVAPFSDQPIARLTFTRTGEEEIQASLEQPLAGQVVAGVGLIRGWAFGQSSAVDMLELFVDGESLGMVSGGSRRMDVGGAFPDNRYAQDSGFGLTMNYGRLTPGEHTLTIQGSSTMGSTFTLSRKIMVRRFGGFEFVGADLSEASVRLDGGTVVIDGVKITDTAAPTMMKTQTVSLRWSQADQGFVVSNIEDRQ